MMKFVKSFIVTLALLASTGASAIDELMDAERAEWLKQTIGYQSADIAYSASNIAAYIDSYKANDKNGKLVGLTARDVKSIKALAILQDLQGFMDVVYKKFVSQKLLNTAEGKDVVEYKNRTAALYNKIILDGESRAAITIGDMQVMASYIFQACERAGLLVLE